jgi:hypothetical protein
MTDSTATASAERVRDDKGAKQQHGLSADAADDIFTGRWSLEDKPRAATAQVPPTPKIHGGAASSVKGITSADISMLAIQDLAADMQCVTEIFLAAGILKSEAVLLQQVLLEEGLCGAGAQLNCCARFLGRHTDTIRRSTPPDL